MTVGELIRQLLILSSEQMDNEVKIDTSSVNEGEFKWMHGIEQIVKDPTCIIIVMSEN